MALIEREDVRRLFHGLVTVLAERDPGRLRTGFQVAELYQQLVPYRTHRSLLGFTTNQDYEGAILGLLAGIGGYAMVDPDEVRQTLAAEVDSPNPDTTLFREFAGARVRLDPACVRDVLADDTAYAPPESAPPPPPRPSPPPPPRGPVFELAGEPSPRPAPVRADPIPDGIHCPSCAAALPTDRPVVFCPFCGTSVGAPACPRCGDELRAAWKFCPRCGAARPA